MVAKEDGGVEVTLNADVVSCSQKNANKQKHKIKVPRERERVGGVEVIGHGNTVVPK